MKYYLKQGIQTNSKNAKHVIYMGQDITQSPFIIGLSQDYVGIIFNKKYFNQNNENIWIGYFVFVSICMLICVVFEYMCLCLFCVSVKKQTKKKTKKKKKKKTDCLNEIPPIKVMLFKMYPQEFLQRNIVYKLKLKQKKKRKTKSKICDRCKKTKEVLYVCVGCKRRKYCSKKCQKKEWAQHKTYCKNNA